MITVALALAADTVLQDAATNCVSAINVVEHIEAARYPIHLPRLCCLFVLRREVADPASINAEIVVTLSEELLYRAEVSIQFGDTLRTRLIAVIGGLVIPGTGSLSVRLARGGETLALWTVPATQVSAPRV